MKEGKERGKEEKRQMQEEREDDNKAGGRVIPDESEKAAC